MSKTAKNSTTSDKKKKSKFRPDNLEEFDMKGDVHQVIQNIYKTRLRGGFIEQGENIYHAGDFFQMVLTFDEKGNKSTEIMMIFDDHYSISFFNEQGQDFKHHSIKNGELDGISFLEFNKENKHTKIIHADKDGKTKDEYRYHYDENGNAILYEHFGPFNNLVESHVNTYNDMNKKIEDKRFDAAGKINYWTTLKYDLQGHENEMTHYEPDGSVKEIKHTRNIYDSDGKLVGMNDHIFNDEPEPIYKEYEHDKKGNWTTKVGFHNNVPAFMVLREIRYYGEELIDINVKYDSDFVKKIAYDLKNPDSFENRVIKEKIEAIYHNPNPLIHQLEPKQIEWLVENASTESFPYFRYYALLNNDIPSCRQYSNDDIEAFALLQFLKDDMHAKMIHGHIDDASGWDETGLHSYVLNFPNRGYVLAAKNINGTEANEFMVPGYLMDYQGHNFGYIYLSEITLYYPSEASGKRDEKFESELNSYISLCCMQRVPDKPEISMVEVSPEGRFKLTTYPVQDNFLIRDLDMHYGFGFEKFHNDLMQRFQSESKGLVLFHGKPGTGKTYYIRHLLRKMSSYKKAVIYMPPNMVEHMVDPQFMTFLSREIARFSKSGMFVVLLVEDAEPLLASRQTNVRVQGISNLLNMTDGLLNDMLKLQIICTFNVEVKELDKALLRPGRLLARKEFKNMTVLDANRLAQQLGVKHHFTKPASLAEVYALVSNKNTLVHGEEDVDMDINSLF